MIHGNNSGTFHNSPRRRCRLVHIRRRTFWGKLCRWAVRMCIHSSKITHKFGLWFREPTLDFPWSKGNFSLDLRAKGVGPNRNTKTRDSSVQLHQAVYCIKSITAMCCCAHHKFGDWGRENLGNFWFNMVFERFKPRWDLVLVKIHDVRTCISYVRIISTHQLVRQSLDLTEKLFAYLCEVCRLVNSLSIVVVV